MNKVGAGLATFILFIALALLGTTIYIHGIPQIPRALFEQPCASPLAVRIESIDPRFELSKESLEKQITLAIGVWNEAAGKTVLVYDPNDSHALPISLIYDARQQEVLAGNSINSTEAAQNTERQAIVTLQEQYKSAGAAYDAAASQFNTESASYQAEVDKVNSSGGADPQTYARLQAEQARLKTAQAALIEQGKQLNALGDTLKARVAAYNESVHSINSVVDAFNAKNTNAFEEGLYTRDASGARIDIYAYKNIGELEHSLAHEMGHALGLDHNENPDSVMYAFTTSSTKITADDLAALRTACKL